MAEAALFEIAKSVLKQLASPALDEFRLLWGHKEQFEKLEATVSTINDVLEDADRKQATDATVRGWLARLRVVLYEADDLFDIISAKVLLEKNKKGTKLGKKVRRIVSKPYRFAFFVKNAHKVKEIRERFDDIARDIKGFNFLPIQTDQASILSGIRREPTHSYVPRNEVIGREQETEDLVRMLLPDCSQQQSGVSVIAVIGIGGLGKTTLAQLVYNDDRVQQGFDLCIWACINYFSSLQVVLMTLLKSTTSRDIDELQSSFRKQIEGKRFLLVLDDVWDEDPQNWRQLKQLLSSGKDGSKVLITTRSETVAQSLCVAEPYFDLKGMSDENAWLLFKKVAFGEEGDRNSSEFEQLGQQIVRKCANVPLAIVTIASLLRGKEKEKWFPLVNNELSKVIPGEYKKIIHILEFSYKELPYPVKRCFGYCSLFPKDYEFNKRELVLLWIAQGFVEPLVNQSLEDRAEDYFFYLVNRCFFQISTNTVSYKMHDLMHDLAAAVAGSETALVDQTEHGSWDKKICHLSIESESKVDHVCSFSHLKSLRTFYRPTHISLKKISLKKLISSFRSLRVLDLHGLGIEKLPTSIRELIHLRWLDLSWNKMEGLPGSICSLSHLQYLNLRWCQVLKELPEDLGNLLSLRHLFLEGCGLLVKMPAGLAALTSMVALDKIVVHNPSGGLKYLENLDNLTGSLQIVLPATQWENATTDAERSFLSRKSRLRVLDIIHKRPDSVEPDTTANTGMNALQPPPDIEDLSICNFRGKEMSQWVSCLHKLVILKLKGCDKCIVLPSFSVLPSLKKLDISYMSSMVAIEDSMSYDPDLFFPSLETLSIVEMPNLTSWWLQAPTVQPAFQRVTNVNIRSCPKLTGCVPVFPLVEDFLLEDVREEIIWQAIGSEATYSASHGNSVLKKLEIRKIEDLSSIAEAQIRHLSALQVLRIQLKSVSWNDLSYLPSLERLEIRWCGEFNWDGEEADVGRIRWPRVRNLEIQTAKKDLFKEWKYMASLETLGIERSFNQVVQEEEEALPWKQLQKLEKLTLGFEETFSMRNNLRLLHGIEDLTSLKFLTLQFCKELYLSWRVLLRLPHLLGLWILEVEKVIDVDSDPMIMQTQPISRSIRKLWICGGSGEWVNDIPWKSFSFVKHLSLLSIRNLEGLPEGIQHLAALESFHITNIKEVVSLPNWMSSLSSLNSLTIWDSCEELKKRCERLTGEDWPKIQHIPYINIWVKRAPRRL